MVGIFNVQVSLFAHLCSLSAPFPRPFSLRVRTHCLYMFLLLTHATCLLTVGRSCQ